MNPPDAPLLAASLSIICNITDVACEILKFLDEWELKTIATTCRQIRHATERPASSRTIYKKSLADINPQQHRLVDTVTIYCDRMTKLDDKSVLSDLPRLTNLELHSILLRSDSLVRLHSLRALFLVGCHANITMPITPAAIPTLESLSLWYCEDKVLVDMMLSMAPVGLTSLSLVANKHPPSEMPIASRVFWLSLRSLEIDRSLSHPVFDRDTTLWPPSLTRFVDELSHGHDTTLMPWVLPRHVTNLRLRSISKPHRLLALDAVIHDDITTLCLEVDIDRQYWEQPLNDQRLRLPNSLKELSLLRMPNVLITRRATEPMVELETLKLTECGPGNLIRYCNLDRLRELHVINPRAQFDLGWLRSARGLVYLDLKENFMDPVDHLVNFCWPPALRALSYKYTQVNLAALLADAPSTLRSARLSKPFGDPELAQGIDYLRRQYPSIHIEDADGSWARV
jgi:hypothetical protein